MIYTKTEEKFPKKPEYSRVLEACRKDFKNFKKDDGNALIEDFRSRIKSPKQLGSPNNVLITQKANLESVRKLIHQGKDDVAFSIFFRTFPSCLPHRSRSL